MKNGRAVIILSMLFVILLVALLDFNFQSVALWSAANQVSRSSPMGDFERSVSNSFPFSGKLSQLRTALEFYSGKRNVNGVFILNNRLIARQPTSNSNAMLRNLQFIQSISVAEKKYLMVIPSAAEIYSSALPNTGETSDKKITVKNLYEAVTGDLTKIDVASVFYIVKDEYIFYKTDRNLTALGGYYLYNSIGNKMGFQVLPKESFDIHYSTKDFYGSLCVQSGCYWISPDTVSSYTYGEIPQPTKVRVVAPDGEKVGKGTDFLSEQLFVNDTINRAFWLAEIDGGLSGGQNLLVITNGIGKAVIPYLTMHYQHITVVDSNCIPQLYQQVKMKKYDQVLFAVDMDQLISTDIYGNFGE